ncbi:hypothetical protein A3C23_03505 [Candidatus Roizmanbacteria bacterium RIFCSPHIGHO2_02_FULL_37_13b]|uniref:Type II secretion system protein GspI C-terminal domain-containing protein n=1 Tax=Candidatus Roizmanbacteria bacterium RIFCSPLOWO2_02_FULL_36_11 TaxID=1802071 RepID=A0A1F7JBY3_9BACT|nr:MAG: hypothetical protein A3C23_03505 [Candidatus Roizmanbacteria bacterium RIFCSPHIGHO2_02_FULL_37_13b]OGK53147.1 MAG: hypothetical protein A3H78_02070 [Candidatus Roizmanbacteria bacterium RIFCSPLOWO2_02_FULL_36_11]
MEIRKAGFTLIEVVIFVSLISVIFVTFAALTTTTIRWSKINEHKILASHNTEELREWLRGQKEADFDGFVAKNGSWCFNSHAFPDDYSSWISSSDPSCGYTLDNNIFKRTVTLTSQENGNKVLISIHTEWFEGSQFYKIDEKALFSLYEL